MIGRKQVYMHKQGPSAEPHVIKFDKYGRRSASMKTSCRVTLCRTRWALELPRHGFYRGPPQHHVRSVRLMTDNGQQHFRLVGVGVPVVGGCLGDWLMVLLRGAPWARAVLRPWATRVDCLAVFWCSGRLPGLLRRPLVPHFACGQGHVDKSSAKCSSDKSLKR